MPGWLRKVAVATYGIFCLAFQARLSYDWLSKESEESERARRPFNIRLFDSEGRVDFTLPESRDAGLVRGDLIRAVDGDPYEGSGGYYRALDRHKAGEILRVRIGRRSEPAPPYIDVKLRASTGGADGRSWGPRDLAYLAITQILTPLVALGLGLLVAVRRPDHALSWIVFAFLVSFSILATGGLSYDPVRMVSQWEPGLRLLALAHMALWLYLWPVLLAVFVIYFPHRAEWDIVRPWLKWMVIVPAVGHALLRAVAFPAAVDAMPQFRELVRLADTRRRLRILLVGSVLAWLPFLVAVFAQDLFGVRATGWPMVVAYSLLLVFPITLAYLILVDRAMDIGLALREGLQYALARRGLYVVQFLLILALVVGLGISLGEPGLRLPQRMQRVAVGWTGAFSANNIRPDNSSPNLRNKRAKWPSARNSESWLPSGSKPRCTPLRFT